MTLDYRKLLAGDPVTTRGFARVVRACVRRRFKFGTTSQIDAVVQDTWVELLAKLEAGNVPDPDRVEAWIALCASNASRREQTRIRNREAVPYESQTHTTAQVPLSERFRQREDLGHIESQLQGMSAEVLQMFVMRLQGHSYAEIAKAVDTRPGAARTSMSRLRRQLTQLLTDQLDHQLQPARDDQSSSTAV